VTTTQRFPIRFTGLSRAMVVLGIARTGSHVEVSPDQVVVRLAWSFTSRFPRSSIRAVRPDTGRVLGWGAHGWKGEWLVNGSSSGIVRIEIDPPVRARVVGVPVTLRVLRVAVEDPDALVSTLGSP
jgi:hypothetical protein